MIVTLYPTSDETFFEHTLKDNEITKLKEATMRSGVFWVLENELPAFPFGSIDTQEGFAKLTSNIAVGFAVKMKTKKN